MKSRLLSLMVLCLLAALAIPAAAQNVQLLQNNDVERWSNGPSQAPDNWSNVRADSIFATQESGRIHGGSYSTNLTWISPTQANCEFLSDPVAVTEGAAYACSTWALDSDAAGRITVAIRWNVTTSYSGIYTVDSSGWQQIGFTITAPAGATTARMVIRAYDVTGWDGNATVYVDDLTLWGPEIQGNIPPSIAPVNRYPYPNVYPGDVVTVRATIVDSDGSIVRDSLYSRVWPNSFVAVPRDSIVGDDYWYRIGTHNIGDSVEYYVIAIDDSLARSQSSTRGYTVLNPNPGFATIYSLQHTTNQGVLPDCFPTDSLNRGVTITGKVVGRYERSDVYRKRCFVQDAANPWSGIYVYNVPDTVQIGDSVTVTGTVIEYYAETELGAITALTKHASGRPLPAPQVVTCANFSSDSCSVTAEPYEGALIQINNITITGDAGNGDFWANDGAGDSVIVMNDLSTGGVDSCVYVIGQTYGYVRGVGRYTYGQYKIAPRVSSDLYIAPAECMGGTIFDVEFTFDPGTDTVDCWPSPDTGQIVTICGIVTAVTQGSQPRFYLQDQNNTAWGGIYCFDFRADNGDTTYFAPGDNVELTSHVKEYYGWTELDSLVSYRVLGSGQPLPDTTVITVSNLISMCDFTTEPYENILVRINNVTVRSDNGFGELWIRDNSTTDSIRIDSDLWTNGTDQPNPLPSPGATYDWIIGVVKWQGRQGAGYERGWVILPRFASDYEQAIIPEPSVVDVWSVNNNTLVASFDRVMAPASTENPANYTTAHGLSITAAVLDSTGRKVTLTTGNQPNNMIDSLIVVNVCDASSICMTTPNHKLYHSGITPIATLQTPNAGGDSSVYVGHIFTIKGVIVADTSMSYPNNLFINDTSGPPLNGVLMYLPSFTPFPHFRDTVTVTARVDEYYKATELTGVSTFNNLVISGAGSEPTPYEITAGQLNATREGFEGVLITLCDSFEITNPAFDSYGFMVRSLTTPSDSFIVHNQPPSHTRYSYVPVAGARINGITGVYRFQREQYRLMPRNDADFNSFDTWCGSGPGCQYVPGDVNNSGVFNGIDVTFMVGYFKGGPVPPYSCECTPGNTWYVAGDVNGNCVFNGIDVTYSVGYFKGGAAPRPCPDCPPAVGASNPGDSPVIPRLKSGSGNKGLSQ